VNGSRTPTTNRFPGGVELESNCSENAVNEAYFGLASNPTLVAEGNFEPFTLPRDTLSICPLPWLKLIPISPSSSSHEINTIELTARLVFGQGISTF
jgi:hypothetical protein